MSSSSSSMIVSNILTPHSGPTQTVGLTQVHSPLFTLQPHTSSNNHSCTLICHGAIPSLSCLFISFLTSSSIIELDVSEVTLLPSVSSGRGPAVGRSEIKLEGAVSMPCLLARIGDKDAASSVQET